MSELSPRSRRRRRGLLLRLVVVTGSGVLADGLLIIGMTRLSLAVPGRPVCVLRSMCPQSSPSE
jgi:hypothetical protein